MAVGSVAVVGACALAQNSPAEAEQGNEQLSALARQCMPIGKALDRAGWQDVATGVAIAAAESGCRDINNAGTNENGSVDYCPMQINSIHRLDVSTLDKCAAAAVKVRKQQGLSAWSTVNNGRARQAKFVAVGNEVAEALR